MSHKYKKYIWIHPDIFDHTNTRIKESGGKFTPEKKVIRRVYKFFGLFYEDLYEWEDYNQVDLITHFNTYQEAEQALIKMIKTDIGIAPKCHYLKPELFL